MAAPLLRSCRLGASLFTAQSQTANKVSQYSTSESLVTSTGKKDKLYRQLTLEIKGHDSAILNSYQKFTAMAAKELGVNIVSMCDPPRIFTRMSLMKSVFVHKKHFHQYEMRTMYKVFQIKHITGSTASTFLEYIQRNLPEGMAMKVTKIQIEQLPSHIKPPADAANQIQSSQQTTKH
ncbi:28S ribosomal protein S10 mitochondrial isoform X3 [Biomphalaria pfeifferi]|uniref:Small ribosomal subunit protein uS10m n=1 Tax=Biomphalaria pfeifferi TaxID=112525 RepID=A0AAD8B9V0_BIOPF|nr:28S ribosomal protein S10 mitochondrial isoform X3 [Biomphalaria pfeifferi]